MSELPQYLNERQVSKMIGRAVQTLRNDRHRGQGIAYIKMGRAVRYKLADVLAFMESRRIDTLPL